MRMKSLLVCLETKTCCPSGETTIRSECHQGGSDEIKYLDRGGDLSGVFDLRVRRLQ